MDGSSPKTPHLFVRATCTARRASRHPSECTQDMHAHVGVFRCCAFASFAARTHALHSPPPCFLLPHALPACPGHSGRLHGQWRAEQRAHTFLLEPSEHRRTQTSSSMTSLQRTPFPWCQQSNAHWHRQFGRQRLQYRCFPHASPQDAQVAASSSPGVFLFGNAGQQNATIRAIRPATVIPGGMSTAVAHTLARLHAHASKCTPRINIRRTRHALPSERSAKACTNPCHASTCTGRRVTIAAATVNEHGTSMCHVISQKSPACTAYHATQNATCKTPAASAANNDAHCVVDCAADAVVPPPCAPSAAAAMERKCRK